MLKASAERDEQALQLALYQAYHTGRYSSYSGDRLPQLAKEIDRYATLNPKPKRQQSPEEMIAALREIKARSIH